MDNQHYQIHAPFEAFYIEAMLFNTVGALNAVDVAGDHIERLSKGEIDYYHKVDEFLDTLQTVINHAGAIARYFFPSPKSKKLHHDRAKFLRDTFSVEDSSPLSNKGLRNAIEHFDEKLDDYLQGNITGHIFPSLILDKPEETEIPHHIFRAFYLEVGVFQVLGERFELQPIVNEIYDVHDKLMNYSNNGMRFKKES